MSRLLQNIFIFYENNYSVTYVDPITNIAEPVEERLSEDELTLDTFIKLKSVIRDPLNLNRYGIGNIRNIHLFDRFVSKVDGVDLLPKEFLALMVDNGNLQKAFAVRRIASEYWVSDLGITSQYSANSIDSDEGSGDLNWLKSWLNETGIDELFFPVKNNPKITLPGSKHTIRLTELIKACQDKFSHPALGVYLEESGLKEMIKSFRPYRARQKVNEMNLIGVRNRNKETVTNGKIVEINVTNEYDDLMVRFRNSSNSGDHIEFQIETNIATTVHGINNSAGVTDKYGKEDGIMIPGHYEKTYSIGKHGESHPNGGYSSLRQMEPFPVLIRTNAQKDTDGDVCFKLEAMTYKFEGSSQLMNIHTNVAKKYTDANLTFAGTPTRVGGYSAGCQVNYFTKSSEWKNFLQWFRTDQTHNGTEFFPYTLISEHQVLDRL